MNEKRDSEKEMRLAAALIHEEAEKAAAKASPVVRMATVTSLEPLQARPDGSTATVSVNALLLAPEVGRRVALLRCGSQFYLLG